MGFVDAVKAVARLRQNHPAAHTDIGQQQIVVAHHHVHRIQNLARQEKRTLHTIGASGFQAAMAVVGDFLPQAVVDCIRPSVAITIKTALGKGIRQLTQRR